MHIFFSGIGGTGIGPLALIAKQAGYEVSGSDKQESQYTHYLQKMGINLYIGQQESDIAKLNEYHKIDWFIYSSALPLENPNHPELQFIAKNNIKHSKRDEFLSHFIISKELKLIACAGTHGKTTSTAMAVWLARQIKLPISYSIGAKIIFGDMGQYDDKSEYFIYECDEFDKNFLSFEPYVSILCKVDWDHHEIYPTRQDYINAFKQFCRQSNVIVAHDEEIGYLELNANNVVEVDDNLINRIKLAGLHNRKNAAAIVVAFNKLTGKSFDELIHAINSYPGSNRRFENLANNIYTDYAHTPEEINATLQLARELNQEIVVIYEPLTNRRQHFMKDAYRDVFKDLSALYWVPSYLAREDESLKIITPEDFIKDLNTTANAKSANLDENLKNTILQFSKEGKLVLLLAGGGGGSLDEWARKNLVA